jgi:hypothetical protein
VLPILLLQKTFVTELLTAITAGSFAFNIAWLQPPADSRANYMDRAPFALLHYLLLYCPAAFDNRGKLPSTVRFKTTRGEDRVDGAR